MAPVMITTVPTTIDLPNKEQRLIAGFSGFGFDVPVLNNDANNLFIEFIAESRTEAEQWRGELSYHLVTFQSLG